MDRDKDQFNNATGSSEGGWITRGRVIVSAVVLVTLFLLSSTHVRIAFQSAAFLSEVFPDSPAYPARWFADEPRRTLVQFPHDESYHGAFLYEPDEGGCHGGIVMYIGLGPEHGDPHLDRVSRAFARNGISVLIPVSIPMVEYRLDPDEHHVAASAFQFLWSRSDIDPERVGMFGISVGGSIVANAAQLPEISEDVAMVHSLGGYYDAETVLVHMALQAFEVDGEWHDWEPSGATYRATRNSIVPLLPSDDRSELWGMFDENADSVPEGLTDEGEALANLLVNRDPELSDDLLAGLPEEVSRFLQDISPSPDPVTLQADTYLLHDRFDHVLPYSESVRFYQDASNAGVDNVRLTVLEQFHHVRPDEEGDRLTLMGDGISLFQHIYQMHRSMDNRGWFSSPLDLLPFGSASGSCW